MNDDGFEQHGPELQPGLVFPAMSASRTQDQERRLRLLEAAHQALRQQDYERIQIKEVAAAAEMALGTVYQIFSSKSHLYAAVLLQWGAIGLPASGREQGRDKGREERVRARVQAVVTGFARWPHLYRLYPALQAAADPNAQALLAEFAADAVEQLASDLRLVDAEPGHDPAFADDAATMLWALLAAQLTMTSGRHPNPAPIDQRTRANERARTNQRTRTDQRARTDPGSTEAARLTDRLLDLLLNDQ